MSKRAVQVNDPNTPVLVDNVSGDLMSLPVTNSDSIIVRPGETVQLSWADYIKLKNIPHFGRFIRLNDSVIISDGVVKISSSDAKLTQDEMVDVLVQEVPRIKEFVLTLTTGEKKLFHKFLLSRKNLGIEIEKCEEVADFLVGQSEGAIKAEKKESQEKTEEAPVPRRGRGRPRKNQEVVVTEGEEALTAHVEKRASDSE